MKYDIGMRSIERLEDFLADQWEIFSVCSVHTSRMPDYETLDFMEAV